MTIIANKAASAVPGFAPTASAWLSSYPVLGALIEALEGDARTARVLSEGAFTETSTLRDQLADAKGRAARTIEQARELHQRPDPARVRADEEMVGKFERGQTRASAEAAQRSKTASDATKLLVGAKEAIAGLAASGAPPRLVQTKLPPGRPLDIITEQRRIIAEAMKGIPAINDAPEPREDREAALIAVLDQTAKDAPFRISRLASSKPTLSWPVEGIEAEPTLRGGIPHATDAAALIAWACYEELALEIKAQLDEQYAGVELTLNYGQKRIALGEIENTIIAAERIEAAATWAARAEGADVPFRGDIDPHCVLGLAGRRRPKRIDNRFGVDRE